MDNSQATPLDQMAAQQTAPPKRQILLEGFALLAVFFVPRLFTALFGRPLAPGSNTQDWSYQLYTQIHPVAGIALIIYLLWSGGERLSDFGIRKLRPSDLLWGALLMGAIYLLLFYPLYLDGVSLSPYLYPEAQSYSRIITAIALAIPTAVFQAIFYRAYLIKRCKQIGYSGYWGVLLGTILLLLVPATMGWYNAPEAWVPLLLGFAALSLYGLAFLKLRSIWPLVIASVGLYAIFTWKMLQVVPSMMHYRMLSGAP